MRLEGGSRLSKADECLRKSRHMPDGSNRQGSDNVLGVKERISSSGGKRKRLSLDSRDLSTPWDKLGSSTIQKYT